MRGIVRRIDELGRIVIPKEIRSLMRIKDGDMIEITFNEEVIKLSKYSKVKGIEEIGNLLCSVLYSSTKKCVLLCDTDKFICSFGLGIKDMFLKLKGIEYLNFLADLYQISEEERKEKIEALSKNFDIYENLNDRIESYSHGMRQKIIVIGAILHNPKNLILDEPMTGLDPKSSHDLKQILKEHTKKGNSVFFSTHVLDVAEKLCDRIGIINKGKLIFVGTYEEMKQKFKENASLEELFLEITE